MSTSKRPLNFAGTNFYIGIDVHLKQWTVTIRAIGHELKTFNMNPSPQQLFEYMTTRYPGGTYHSVYEAGFCGFWIHRQLCQLGIHNLVVNPADVPTRGKERTNKNDKPDSRKLARELSKEDELVPIYVPSEAQQQLRSLCRLRFRTRQSCTRVQIRIISLLHFLGKKIPPHAEMPRWSGHFLKWLEGLTFSHPAGQQTLQFHLQKLQEHRRRLTAIMRQLRAYSRTPEFARTYECLASISGIGFITAITLLTELMDIVRFATFDQLACFVGLIPAEHASGQHDSASGITPRRNKYLRTLLIEAAWTATREDPALTLAFKELIKRMSPERAIVRIAKKLLRRLRHAWRHQTLYVTGVVA